MLTLYLFTLLLTISSIFAHPILPRQEEQRASASASLSVLLASQSDTPSPSSALESISTPAPSASESINSIESESLSQSSAPVSASSVSESASQASESLVPSTSLPTPSPSPTVEPKPDVPTFTPDQLTVTNTLPPSSVIHYVTASPEPSVAAVASGATQVEKSFWDNKPAVIGTFVVVGLVALSLIALAFFAIRKRKMQESLDSDFFEKFNDTHSERSESRTGTSPNPSMTDMHSQKPMAVKNDFGMSAVAPHLAFNTQNYSYGYGGTAAGQPASHGRNGSSGSGDSFYGAAANTQRMPTYTY